MIYHFPVILLNTVVTGLIWYVLTNLGMNSTYQTRKQDCITRVLKFFLSFWVFFLILSGVRLSPLGTVAITGLLYQPQMIEDGDCGVVGGMKIGRGNRSTRRKPAPAPHYPPQIPHDLTRKPATNRLSYGMTFLSELQLVKFSDHLNWFSQH
jgi:hypothetical protein